MDFDSLGCFYRVFGHWFCYHRRCILKSTEQFGSDSSHVEERHLPTTFPCDSQNATNNTCAVCCARELLELLMNSLKY